MRELYRRLVDYRKTRTGEITRRKRIRCLKKQEGRQANDNTLAVYQKVINEVK